MAAFSRLQLAAALLEYDNDPNDPHAPQRSAHDSAIFAHLRRAADARPRTASRASTDYLGVALPSERAKSQAGRQSVAGRGSLAGRGSVASIDALRNPFGTDEGGEYEAEYEEEGEMEVDLSSWGLSALVGDDKKASKKSRKRRKSETVLSTSTVRREVATNPITAGSPRQRSSSMGNFENFGLGGAFLDAQSTFPHDLPPRPRSVAYPGEFSSRTEQRPPHFRRASEHGLIDNIAAATPLLSVPFPGSGTEASASRPDLQGTRTVSGQSVGSAALNNDRRRERGLSVTSLGSRTMLPETEEPNPFAVRPPSPDRASRFDPKARLSRALSNASREILDVENIPLAARPVAGRSRTMSTASFGSRMLPENDGNSIMSGHPGQPHRRHSYSKWDLMRPKVLVMPSPLQGIAPPSAPKLVQAPEGFQLSTEGTPLPPGARSASRRSLVLSTIQPTTGSSVPNPSNSFTPNPRMSMTLSQLTFRNTLMVGGERDAAYTDIDATLPRATQEGEQVRPTGFEEAPEAPVIPVPSPSILVEEPEEIGKPGRRPGALYGRSLIDDLEARKAEIKGKTRVFRGDDRPSMMARAPMKRTSTLIDPATLNTRPLSQQMNSFGSSGSMPPLGRKNSANVQPLLKFEDKLPSPGGLSPSGSMTKTRSVFGVDKLWESEMAKLKEIEAEEAEARKRAALEGDGDEKKKGRKRKGAVKTDPRSSSLPTSQTLESNIASPSQTSPAISASTSNKRLPVRSIPPPIGEDDSESESDDSDAEPSSMRPGMTGSSHGPAGWNSSDEEDGPRRTTGVGLRNPKKSGSIPTTRPPLDDDSDEDLPLAATINRAVDRVQKAQPSAPDGSDSDEEKPLVSLLEKVKLKLPTIDFDRPSAGLSAGDDEDETPLALRASMLVSPRAGPGAVPVVDDDVPLAMHPEQQRRTQYQMMAAHQQQIQQQMMMQAQMHNSMFFGAPPSIMGSGFFNPAMAPPMMMMPPVAPSPPVNDVATLGRVDKWRRDVAVEGER